jgi:hypothetical protein
MHAAASPRWSCTADRPLRGPRPAQKRLSQVYHCQCGIGAQTTPCTGTRTCQYPQVAPEGDRLPVGACTSQLCVEDLGPSCLGDGQLGCHSDKGPSAGNAHVAPNVVAPRPHVPRDCASASSCKRKRMLDLWGAVAGASACCTSKQENCQPRVYVPSLPTHPSPHPPPPSSPPATSQR